MGKIFTASEAGHGLSRPIRGGRALRASAMSWDAGMSSDRPWRASALPRHSVARGWRVAAPASDASAGSTAPGCA